MSNKNLKEKCHYYRRQKMYQQKDLALLLNVSASALSKWENGHAPWPPDAFELFCELLELSEDEKQELAVLARLEPPETSSVKTRLIDDKPQEPALKKSVDRSVTVLFGVVVFILIGSLLWNKWPNDQPVWQETFDPIQRTWSPISARWHDVNGPTAYLEEDNVDEDFGKVESEIIRIDVDKYPILRIEAESVNPDASFTVQILDKQTNISKDVLKGISYPGEHIINLKDEMGWQGPEAFTINIWISGEGKSAQFRQISIETEQ